MKRNGKLLITFGLIITMLFGNIMTLYAKTTNSVLADLAKYFTYINTASAVFATVNNKTYDYSVFTWKSDKPCYVTYVENPNSYMEEQGLNGGYAGTFLIVSNESEIQWGYSLINTDEKGIEECLNREITFKKNGWTKTIQDENGQDWYVYDLGLTVYRPVNSYDFMMLRTEHTLKEFINLLFTGTLDGNVDIAGSVTSYDKSLGYLHDLHHKKLVTKTSEEGFPLESTDKFTWSDSYPDYDKTYKVDLYVICNVQERSMWLPWKKKTFSSSRTYVKSGLYKDLEFGVTNDELNAIFSSFHSPDGNSNSIFKVRSWNYDFYFRIVKDGKHGPWTIWKHTGEVLDGEVDGSVSVGEEDENGNIILIPDTEYGQGMPDDTEVGIGDDEKDAEDNIGQDQFEIKDILSWVDWFFNTLKLFISSMKDLPSLFASIFSFLPSPIVFLLSAVIVVIIILRILGR